MMVGKCLARVLLPKNVVKQVLSSNSNNLMMKGIEGISVKTRSINALFSKFRNTIVATATVTNNALTKKIFHGLSRAASMSKMLSKTIAINLSNQLFK